MSSQNSEHENEEFVNFTLKFSFLKSSAKLTNLEVVQDKQQEHDPGSQTKTSSSDRASLGRMMGLSQESGEEKEKEGGCVSLAVLITLIIISVSLLLLLLGTAYRLYQAQLTNTYWVN